MAIKVKGIFKGMKNIFDEKNEKEMQIGLPTDVKHVAHIGFDGPSVDSPSPSWMKGFEALGVGNESTPMNTGETIEKHEMKQVSGDSKQGPPKALDSPPKEVCDIPKPTRQHARHHSLTDDTGTSSPRKEKPRRSKRNQLKESINNKLNPDGSGGVDSPAGDVSDIPKKSRRKKSKDSNSTSTSTSTTSSRPSKPSRGRRSSSACSSDPESSGACLITNKECGEAC